MRQAVLIVSALCLLARITVALEDREAPQDGIVRNMVPTVVVDGDSEKSNVGVHVP